jgi:uncharacterized protein YciI
MRRRSGFTFPGGSVSKQTRTVACRREADRRRDIDLERYTITLRIYRPDGPDLGEEEAAALQDAHMSYLADLAEEGALLTTGPLSDDDVCALSILDVDPERACELMEDDPAVQAGVYTIWAVPWTVPAGAISFSPARLPHTTASSDRP